MRSEIILATSEAADEDFTCTSPHGPPCRWGDYAGATPDPSSSSTVWGTSMLNGLLPAVTGDPQWKTQNFAVSTADTPPVAAFVTATQPPLLSTQPLSFDASTSSDSDGIIATYAWNFGDGGTGTGAKPSHAYALPGTYTVKLKVTDNDGSTGLVSHDVVVTNHPPTAAFSYAPATPAPTQPVAFDGRASSDPDGTVAAYAWDFGDGTSGGGPTPSHAYAAPGTYTVTLTVTDDHGATSAVSQAVSVAGQAPVVQALAAGAIGVHAAVLNGNVDPRGQATRYAFEYGPTATYGSRTPDASLVGQLGGLAASAAVSGLRAGSVLHYRLVATNASGTTASADQTLTTLAAPTARVTLTATVSRRRRHLPSRITARGSVAPPPGATAGVCSGNVTIQLTLGKRSAKRSLRLSSHCAFGGSVAVPSSLQRRGQLTVQVSFAGSADLGPARSPRRRLR